MFHIFTDDQHSDSCSAEKHACDGGVSLAAINSFKGGSRLGIIVSVVSMRKHGSGNETCFIEHVWECLTKIEPI
jgi:hypothetical protein